MAFFTYFCSMEERKYIVYIHKNKINGKVYVGITHYTNPEKRWRGGREYKRNVLFNKAIQKYGWDNFEHLILFKNLPQEAACKIEVLLIKRYRVKNSCYNIADGGQGASAMNDVIKDKISKAGIGKRVGEFVKEYKSISEANMEFGINKKSSAISRACKEERKTAYGFIWKFKEKEVMYGT